MKIARVSFKDKVLYAKYEDNAYYQVVGDIFSEFEVSEKKLFGEVKILPPVTPSKVVAVGINYKNHAKELSMELKAEPLIFLKPPSAIIGDGDNIVIPEVSTKTDYEAELAVIIKKTCKNVKTEEAKDYILGYTAANDVTERVIQKKDGQWARAKGFDTFLPLGALIETEADTQNLELMTIRNGEIVQKGNTSDMVHNVDELISFISGVMTLNAGDVILTGTPEGIGEIKRGDTVEIVIQGIGSLKNYVI